MPSVELTSPEVALLFWNVQKKDLKHSIVRMVQGHNINVLVLAEFDETLNAAALLNALNEPPRLPDEDEYRLIEPKTSPRPRSAMSRLLVFTRLPAEIWTLHAMHNRYAVWTVSVAHRRQCVLATVHFPSVQEEQGDKQREIAVALRRDIEEAEAQAHDTEPLTVVIGDFNANPFDAGIAAVYGLNATHIKEVAERGYRAANGRRHPYFYNPMWRFLGAEPWGTYFNDKLTSPVRYDWFLLDQVLVRPDVIPLSSLNAEASLVRSDLQILTSDGIIDFNLAVKRSSSSANAFSDHLPLYFRFDLPAQADEILLDVSLPEQENANE